MFCFNEKCFESKKVLILFSIDMTVVKEMSQGLLVCRIEILRKFESKYKSNVQFIYVNCTFPGLLTYK